jgi:non-canonical (house-cleaning) NTP pyrophosphatase
MSECEAPQLQAVAAAPSLLRVVVSSTNPVKVQATACRSPPSSFLLTTSSRTQIEATRLAFSRTFPACDVVIISVSVPSGVPDQPMGDDQTRQGALNRACNARDMGQAADFFVGLEGGCVFEAPVVLPSKEASSSQARPQELSCFAWGVVIKAQGSTVGAARTASFQLPESVANLVSQVSRPLPLCSTRIILFGREWSSALRMTWCSVASTASAPAGQLGFCLVV